MTSLQQTVFLTAITLCVSLNATAGHNNSHQNKQHNNKYTDYARVLSAQPVYRSVSRQVPRQECHIESISYQEANPNYRSDSNYHSGTPMILGGLIGGAIGHKAGHHKKAKNAGAVVGALLGGSIGRDLYSRSKRNQPQNHEPQTITRYRDEEVCRTQYYTEREDVLDGYDVSYEYQGRNYFTRMKRDPGRDLRIAVNLRPIE